MKNNYRLQPTAMTKVFAALYKLSNVVSHIELLKGQLSYSLGAWEAKLIVKGSEVSLILTPMHSCY